MASIFEKLMVEGTALTESVNAKRKKTCECKKIDPRKIKVESRRVFETTDFDELDAQFAVDPEAEETADEIVLVIDPEIPAEEEVPEDAAEEMVGDTVYKCPVCGSNYVCDCEKAELGEGIAVDEDGIPTECPICGDDADQILVGEIAPVEEAGEEGHMDPVDTEDAETEETPDEEEEVVEEESLSEGIFGKKKTSKGKSREVKPAILNIGDNVYYHGDEGIIKNIDKESSPASGETTYYIELEDGTEFAATENSLVTLRESFEEEVIDEVDDSEVEVSETPEEVEVVEIEAPEESEDKEDLVLDLNVAEEEVAEAPVVEINDSEVTLMLDDTRLESMMSKVIRENYKGDSRFTITRAALREGKLRIEYVVRQGKSFVRGTLLGEGFDKSARVMKIKFVDKGVFTESFAKTPSFIVECVKLRNIVTPVSLKYDYKVKVNESLYRIHGKVGK